MQKRTNDTESTYLASLISACAGGMAVWLGAHLWGVPAGELAHSETAALLGIMATAFTLGTIAFIEMEASR
jgi:hypothetical protein